MKTLFRLIVLLMVTASVDVSAQGAKPSTLADLVKYRGADREKILYEGAKREGSFVWYTSLVPHKEISKVFMTKYPGVSIDIYRADGVTLANRAIAEHQARRARLFGDVGVPGQEELGEPDVGPEAAEGEEQLAEVVIPGLVQPGREAEAVQGHGGDGEEGDGLHEHA